MFDLFSVEGITAWRAHLASSDEFARAAGTWRGTMLLVEGDADAPTRATWLEVGDGQVVAARPAEPGDREQAEFVLAASQATWQALVGGRLELLAAAMRGELRLVAGSVLRLLPHARAASAMLRAAAEP
jgi:putative sterol carrier protein